MYEEHSSVIRMCTKPTGGNPISIEIPRHAFLKNANARDIHTAAGFYTLAASCPGALAVFTMHSRFWGNMLWDQESGYGEPTPYRGAPIVDVSVLLTPLTRSELYLSMTPVGQGKKARVAVPLGFKVAKPVGDGAGGSNDDDEDDGVVATEIAFLPAMAEIAIMPRKITTCGDEVSPYSISTDMRLSIHGAVPMDLAHVMTVYVEDSSEGVPVKRYNLMNLDYNAARDVGGTPVVAGKKHAWSSAMPSAIDDIDDEDEDGGADKRESKRMKAAMDSVA